MTEQEQKEFAEFQQYKAAKLAAERSKQDREAYREVVEQAVERCFPCLEETAKALTETKAEVYQIFESALALKKELFTSRANNYSHTFINATGDKRIILGKYMIDDYADTVADGIAIVKEVIEDMAQDDNSRALVNAVLRLLSRDQKGNLKASRVLQLRKLADEINNRRFAEGVQIIEESYRPSVSKTYVRAEYKDSIGQWKPLALGMTEAGS